MSQRKTLKPVDLVENLLEDSASFEVSTRVSQDCSFKVKKTKWLTSKEAATYLNISIARLRNMSSNGQIPYYKLGRSNRYSLEELNLLLQSGRRGSVYGN